MEASPHSAWLLLSWRLPERHRAELWVQLLDPGALHAPTHTHLLAVAQSPSMQVLATLRTSQKSDAHLLCARWAAPGSEPGVRQAQRQLTREWGWVGGGPCLEALSSPHSTHTYKGPPSPKDEAEAA